MVVLRSQNPGNCQQKTRPLGAHELDQQVQITSYQGNQAQQSALP